MTSERYRFYADKARRLMGRSGRYAEFTYRVVTQLGRADPSPNPPTAEGLALSAALAAGDTQLGLRGTKLRGHLLAGDAVLCAGLRLVVASGPVRDDGANGMVLPLAGPATAALAAGTAATLALACDTAIKGRVASYGERIADGTLLKAGDYAFELLAGDLAVAPEPGHQVLCPAETARWLTVFGVIPKLMNGFPVGYRLQAR